MEELYAEYGRLLVQAEILQGKINECKAKIAEALRAPKPVVAPTTEEKKDG